MSCVSNIIDEQQGLGRTQVSETMAHLPDPLPAQQQPTVDYFSCVSFGCFFFPPSLNFIIIFNRVAVS